MTPFPSDLIDIVPGADAFENGGVDGVSVVLVLAHQCFCCGVIYFQLFSALVYQMHYFLDLAVVAQHFL